MKKRLNIEVFKRYAKLGLSTEDVILTKAIKADSESDEESRILRFRASTSAVDRDADTIRQKGWDLKDFRKSGVFLWAHDAFLPPLAAVKGAKVEEDLMVDVAFPERGKYDHPLGKDFGAQVFDMYKEGLLHAVSVGFEPLKFTVNEERSEELRTLAYDFTKQRLIELSAVPIPANPEALLAGRKQFGDFWKSWAECERDTWHQSGASKESLEETVKALNNEAVSVNVPEQVDNESQEEESAVATKSVREMAEALAAMDPKDLTENEKEALREAQTRLGLQVVETVTETRDPTNEDIEEYLMASPDKLEDLLASSLDEYLASESGDTGNNNE